MIRQSVLVAGLALLIWDIIANFPREYKFIWSPPPFFIKRPLAKPPFPESYCRRWFTLQATFVQICSMLLGIILLLRVYTLYNRSRNIGYIVGILFTVDIARASARIMQFKHQLRFDAHCTIQNDRSTISALSGLLFLVSQGTIWGLTWRKRGIGNQLSIPLIQTAARDGAFAFAALSISGISVLAYSLKVSMSAEVMLLFPMIVFSIVGCRTVLNLQENGNSTEETEEENTELLEVSNE
ncbi:hypothetical protein BDQ17DRAFT_947106 [Cyathus striatus]|nr:hypothetical protein BDQ17DRAFT_947106 [Cyathus striatus]